MRIGVDIDDTIADLYEVAFAYAQKYTIEELGRSAKIQDYTAKHHTYLNIMHGWSYEEEMNFWHQYYQEILMLEKPFTLAVETIKQLKMDGHEIVIVTARYPEDNFDVEAATLEWLKENDIVYDEIVLDASDKAKVAIEKKLDMFLDDSFQNCVAVASHGVQTFIMDTRVNKGLVDDKIERVYSWPDFYSKIKRRENFNGTLRINRS